MEPVSSLIVTDPKDLTATWASSVLGTPIGSVTVAAVGTGQIGTVYRVTTDDVTLLVKLPASDPAARDLLAGAYRGEVRFYSEIAQTVAIRVARTYLAAIAPEGADFTLVMEDLAPAAQGDQIAGCSDAQAHDAVVNLAGLHGPRWCDPTLLEIEGLSLNGPAEAAMMSEFFGPAVDIFVDGLRHLLDDDTVAVIRRTAEVIEQWALGRAERFGLVHGDYRLDNLIFPPNDQPGSVAVDWQTLSLALPARDLAYFTATSLLPEQRRALERDLVAAYHRTLVSLGVQDYPLDLCWDDYRYAMLQAPLVTVFGCAYGTRTERGDEMFAAMANRAARAITELESFPLIAG